MEINFFVDGLKETLEQDKVFIMPINGTSMQPFLHTGDLVALSKPFTLKKNDIVFYLRDNGQYVLHRIFKVKKNKFFLLGDHQTKIEKNIREDQILAKAIYVIINEKKVLFSDKKYRLYLFFWRFRFLRYLIIKLRKI